MNFGSHIDTYDWVKLSLCICVAYNVHRCSNFLFFVSNSLKLSHVWIMYLNKFAKYTRPGLPTQIYSAEWFHCNFDKHRQDITRADLVCMALCLWLRGCGFVQLCVLARMNGPILLQCLFVRSGNVWFRDVLLCQAFGLPAGEAPSDSE